MNTRILKANLILLLAATVWGSTFVAQRVGMDNLGPFGFSGIRFALGALTLFPLAWRQRRIKIAAYEGVHGRFLWLWGSLLAGIAMFGGINLQQVGLVDTSAGNAGFITGLYVVIVPILGLLFGRRPGAGVWIGAVLGAVGLYFLSVTKEFSLAPGDGWVLLCAFVWAVHVWVVGYFSPRMVSSVLACGQASVCAILSLIAAAVAAESITLAAIKAAALPVLWGGFMSVALGFTLQVVGQKDSPPAHAAIILSMEAVVAMISGWLILSEPLTARSMLGAGLMLSGMLIAQLWALRRS